MTDLPQSLSPVTETPDIIGVLRSVHSALDDALGDTDVSHIENDDELRDEYPVQWAAGWLMHAIEALEEAHPSAGLVQTGQQQIKDAFYAGYWAWFGPATQQELERGCSELDKSWLEYEAALSDTSTDRQRCAECDCGDGVCTWIASSVSSPDRTKSESAAEERKRLKRWGVD